MNAFSAALKAMSRTTDDSRLRTVGLEALRRLCAEQGQALDQGVVVALDQGIAPNMLRKNFAAISVVQQTRLVQSSVLVAGAGGLGGFVLETLARMGVGHIRVADGDVFDESNLNRQLLAAPDTLGENKAHAAAARIGRICPHVRVEALDFFLDAATLPRTVQGMDIVVDALGGIAPRCLLHEAASHAAVPVVSAALAGWTGVVGSELPGETGISRMWADIQGVDAEQTLGSLAATAAVCASIQAAEVVHYLTTKTLHLAGKMLHIDLAAFHFELYDFH